jgi:hypothetical protein
MPGNFVTDITANASGIIGDLSPFITLVLGVLLAGTVVVLILRAVSGR